MKIWVAAVLHDRTDGSLLVMSGRIHVETGHDIDFSITKSGAVNAIAVYDDASSRWPRAITDTEYFSVLRGDVLAIPRGVTFETD